MIARARLDVGSLRGDTVDERDQAMKTVVGALNSPHESDDYLVPITKDELAEAHAQEFHMLRDFDVFEEVDEDETKGHKVITSRWVDRRKPGGDVRARLCAREFAHKDDRLDVYASTPSGVASRIIDAIACAKGYNTMSADVSSAFLHAKVDDETVIYIQPPDDFVPMSNIPRKRCRWRLRRWLYGLRGSPAAWQHRFAQILEEDLGFTPSDD